jgi:medium-chain acyl-[acyl-carrier-protein] hydrolase
VTGRRAIGWERLSGGWFVRHRRTVDPTVRLFCFPFAGGGAAAFAEWSRALPLDVDVLAFEAPGRGTRMMERPLHSLMALVEAAEQAVRPLLDRSFALFGHSMGAIVAFELARMLRRQGGPEPTRLLVSGSCPPGLRRAGPPRRRLLHALPDRELILELRRLNGTPREVCESDELMEILLPVLRADFEAIERHRCGCEAPLACAVSAYGGRQDPEVTPEELAAWRDHTSGPFSASVFPGDHFYLATEQAGLLAHVARDIRACLRP